jgi:predicted aspartyl protease
MNLEISKSFTYKQEKVEVEYANGSKMNQCSIQTAKVNIEDCYHSDDFIVATIDKYDAILGREWLRRVNSRIDWRLGTVTFEFQGRQHCWQS